jgi:hypothetical protein
MSYQSLPTSAELRDGLRGDIDRLRARLAAALAALDEAMELLRKFECERSQQQAMTEAGERFAAYFRKNYPGLTTIGDPDWHAPRIFRAALRALPAPEVTEAMVRVALDVWFSSPRPIGASDDEHCRDMRAALAAALSAQQGEGSRDE